MRRLVALSLFLLVSLSCSTDRDPSELLAPNDIGLIVVDAVLIAGPPFQEYREIRLSQTLDPSKPYTPELAALRGATVTVSTDTTTYAYFEVEAGIYVPEIEFIVSPGETYRLRVQAADGRVVRASTTVPPQIAIDQWLLLEPDGKTVREELPADECSSVLYSDGLLEARTAAGNQIGYVVGLVSLDGGSPPVIDIEELNIDLEDLPRKVSSPPLAATEGMIRLPWLAIYYEGNYNFRMFAIDRNWYDLLRSTPDIGGLGFGGQAGDNFERPIFNVDGGIGVFGSATIEEKCFDILPRP